MKNISTTTGEAQTGALKEKIAFFKINIDRFWLELNGAFIHIRYLALRDENGEYLGTMEVSQDLTRLRTLKGERRLLQYEE